MPQEHKKRGRREEKKRKHQGEKDEEEEPPSWRLKQTHGDADLIDLNLNGETPHHNQNWAGRSEIPFYGLLDEDEQEYFKRADSMLELNQFTNDEEKRLFLTSVYKEANGKELKIVNSQSCSRLMERLIIMSNLGQLKTLFQNLNGQ